MVECPFLSFGSSRNSHCTYLSLKHYLTINSPQIRNHQEQNPNITYPDQDPETISVFSAEEMITEVPAEHLYINPIEYIKHIYF